ncbi:carboxypeptidase-like regulatory domain-containing protein [Pontibacter silvestris]|uniref:Carboxypeptidase-like regulatory domain-containing protein n=1 Tax=Pontibacter silvestris TaxID=2305183 RepID=A0ABW4X0X0_9BACT|nr:carboxypeptidase-like regulatory domain-containing protein [Pontibacter silvestris]MCC9135773.1 carboxypeptidase-like regulatory domain-containing protein [Pontibacter silvestris]
MNCNLKGFIVHFFDASGFIVLCLLLLLALCPAQALAQKEADYDEVPLLVNIQGTGSVELLAMVKDKDAYLPVKELFDFLKIKNTLSPDLESISGFFISEAAVYQISLVEQSIVYQNNVFPLESGGLIATEFDLYLRTDYLDKVFGLNCSFNFRGLSIIIKTDKELPIVREKRLEQMRLNIKKLAGDIEADSTIARTPQLFRLGAADWSIFNSNTFSTQSQENETQQQSWQHTMLNLSLGAALAGGEADISLNYAKGSPFPLRNQYYLWSHVRNENPLLRQVKVGRINTNAVSSVFSPVNGIQFTNASTINKQSFGTYQISDVTGADWVVELYINSVLVDYVRADKNGFYSLEVPLVYGSSSIQLRFYGPWGEERIQEKTIQVPYNLVPPNELEYTVSAALTDDEAHRQLYRGDFSYGLSRLATVGGGMEYFPSLPKAPLMPFVNTSVMLFPGVILSAEHMHQVRTTGVLNYQHPNNVRLELMYAKYKKDQKAITSNYLEERKATLSKPFKTKWAYFNTQLSFNQTVLPTFTNTRAEFMLSGSFSGLGASLNSYLYLNSLASPYYYTNLALSYSTRSQYNFTLQNQYDHNLHQMRSSKVGLDKKISGRAAFTAATEKNFVVNYQSFEVGFRYDFSFSQVSAQARYSGNSLALYQNFRGGLYYNHNNKTVKTHARTGVGRGGITVISFLDINNNRKHDDNEPKVSGVEPRINGGVFEYSEKDTTYSVSNLAPHTYYLINLDHVLLPSISWRVEHESVKVMVEPNYHKVIEVPVSVVGEVTGMVLEAGSQKGMGRVKVSFFLNGKTLVGSTFTEDDGYFSYFNLRPGHYTAKVDEKQMHNTKMISLTEAIPFAIKVTREGDFIDGLEFYIDKK